MKNENKIRATLVALSGEARKSEDREAYAILRMGAHYRLGAGVRIDANGNEATFLEILMAPEKREIEINVMEKKIAALKLLRDLGFRISGEDDGSISCEISTNETDLVKKFNQALGVLIETKLDK